MNKTLKTIAWICLILGILGTAADAGILVAGHRFLSARGAPLAEMRLDLGKKQGNPDRNFCIAEDADNDGKPDGDCLQGRPSLIPGSTKQGFGGIASRGGMPMMSRGRFNNNRLGHQVFLPIFLFLMGPVLAIVGAVILLVNRSPRTAGSKDNKEIVADKKDHKKEAKAEFKMPAKNKKNKESK